MGMMEIQDTRLMEREGQKDCQEEINPESVSSPETQKCAAPAAAEL